MPSVAEPCLPGHILVSFCGMTGRGAAQLGLIDLADRRFRVLRLPEAVPQGEGFTGLAMDRDLIYAVLPCMLREDGTRIAAPSRLLALARDSFAPVCFGEFAAVRDGHSILAEDGVLHVVSSRTNSVVRVRLDGSRLSGERTIWRAAGETDPPGDSHHLNGICRWRGELAVSGFGRRGDAAGDAFWNTARQGFLRPIPEGELLMSGLQHPHAPLATEDGLFICESLPAALHALDGRRAGPFDGYTRGLCAIGDDLWIGTSIRRRVSRSTGRPAPLDGSGPPVGRCAVHRLDRASLELRETIDLSAWGHEIYDLLPVPEGSGWPDLPADAAAAAHQAFALSAL